jgi:hypothetical protein
VRTETRLTVIVTVDGNPDLVSIAQREDVWIVDTPVNRALAEASWKIVRAEGLHDVTTFKADDSVTADQWVARLLASLHDHYDLDADKLVLTVEGVGITHELREALSEFGPLDIAETPIGFVASREHR